MIRKNLLIATSVILLSACGSGSSSINNPNPTPTSTVTSQQYIPGSAQIKTPSSIFAFEQNSNLKVSNLSTNADNCFVIVPQSNGNNYTTTINSSQWWSTAAINFQVQNSCSTAQMISTTAIISGLTINGNAVPMTDIQISQSGSLYLTTTTTQGQNINDINVGLYSPSCTGDWCSWAEVKPGSVTAITAQMSLGAPINSLVVGDVIIQGSTPPPPPPPAPGELDVTVNASQLQQLCSTQSCNIQVDIIAPSSAILDTLNINPKIQSSVTGKYQNLAPGSYTMSVVSASIPTPANGGSIGYTYVPAAAVNVPNGGTANGSVNFAYTAPTPQGSITVNLANVANAEIFANIGQINGLATDQTTLITYPFLVALGGSTTLSNLPAGHTYSLSIQGIADPLTGIYYKANSLQTAVTDGNTVKINLNYTQVSAGLSNVAFTVNNSPSGQLISFADDNQTYKYNTDTLQNGNYTFDDSIAVALTIQPKSGYSVTTTPSPLVINNALPGTVTITFSENNNKHIVVGYVDGTAIGAFAAITDSAFAKYDVIIVGFSNCNATNYNCDQTADAALLPIFQRISQNAKPGAVILLSIGGENGSYSFHSNVANLMPTLAQSLISDINYLNSQITTPIKIAGIDIDIEANDSGPNITPLAQTLFNKGYVVSVAPQASTNGIGVTNPVSPSTVDPTVPTNFIMTASGTSNNDYGPAIAAGYVSYINLQAYNSGPGVININRGNGTNSDETVPDFHQYAAQMLNNLVSTTGCGGLNPVTNYYANGNQVCIPVGTKILVGTVANKTAGGAATMWANEIQTPAGNAAILASFTQSVLAASSYPYYGGVMVWALGNDYYPSAWGNNTWDPVGAFTNNIVNFGF